MTMFTLPNFCRVCLKYDKNLIDLEHIENEPNETLMSKLQHCVSDVEWSVFKPLLCHPCIKRLNIAYSFKKQCSQSASMLTSYIALVKEKGDGNVSNNIVMLPNQKYIKIVVGGQNQNNFQNVFLNLVPNSSVSTDAKSKDTNQNKLVAIAPNDQNSINEFFFPDASKSEELSVEIDPTDFSIVEVNSDAEDSERNSADFEDLISSSQISSSENGVKIESGKNYVPILPKTDEKMEFFNSGTHFLTSSAHEFTCEECHKQFSSIILLRNHIKHFHMGKMPFKCEHCYSDFAIRYDYDVHTSFCDRKKKKGKNEDSLTLDDFKDNKTEEMESTDAPDLECNICNRTFNSASGLLRHKMRKHNQKAKKKYFIKGMKNAKCDICDREFSTQSYMQLHRKLHLRDDVGYKYKVFSKNHYTKNERAERTPKARGKKEENITVCNIDDDDGDELLIKVKEEIITDASFDVNYEDSDEN